MDPENEAAEATTEAATEIAAEAAGEGAVEAASEVVSDVVVETAAEGAAGAAVDVAAAGADAAASGVMDLGDPVLLFVVYALTEAAKRWGVPDRFHKYLPILAVALGIGGRAAYEATAGMAITTDTLAHGFASGASAVAAHQMLFKQLATDAGPPEADRDLKDTPTDEKA